MIRYALVGLLAVLMADVASAEPPPDVAVPAGAHDLGTNALKGLSADQIDKIFNNYGHEVVVCMAFFNVVKEAFRRADPNHPGITNVDRSVAVLSERALSLQDQDVVLARFKIAMREMTEKMQGTFDRFSIIFGEYGLACQEVREDPIARLVHWRKELYPGQ